MGLNTNCKVNDSVLSINNNTAFTQVTSSKMKSNGANFLTGSSFIGSKNQIPITTYIKNLDVNLALDGSSCVGGDPVGTFNPGEYFIWYNPSRGNLYWMVAGSSWSIWWDETTSGVHLLKEYNFTYKPSRVKIYLFVQGGGGGGGGGIGGPAGKTGGSGGGGGGAAFTPVFLGYSPFSRHAYDYSLKLTVGSGGQGGNGKTGGTQSGGDSIVTVYQSASFGGVWNRNVAIGYGGGWGTTGNAYEENYDGGAGGGGFVELLSTTHTSFDSDYIPYGTDVAEIGFKVAGGRGGKLNADAGDSVGAYSLPKIDVNHMFNKSTRGGYSGGTVRDSGTRPGGSGGASPNGPGGASGKDKEAGAAPTSGWGGGGGGSSYKGTWPNSSYYTGGNGANGVAWVWA